MLALSESCAPDAALGSLPLVYPFVVNDPGEGVQAKRRAHATIVDHLVPPMMRADTYDEMAELEALLDEYARLEVLDPSKLPGLAARIWSAIERANLQADLDIHERPEDVGTLVEHIDGYLCEVKDIQVKDGLHVLGRAPRGDQLRGLVSAMLRLGSGDVPGLRRAVGAAFGLDEPALVAAARRAGRSGAGGARASASAGPAPARATSSIGSRTRTWRCSTRSPRATGTAGAAAEVCARSSALADAGVERALRFACDEVVPRILRTPDELTSVVRALRGRHIAVRALGRADPRAHRRAADRAQLLLRRPARAALRAVVGGRPAARRRAARPPPGARPARCRGWSASSPGAPPRCARRATTWPRSSRCSACGRPGIRSPSASRASRSSRSPSSAVRAST